ncbi:MAG: hypothetical protein IKZ68_00835 [Bacilli bacterium]|nr:hypothetical protein [Bacilli bacterium]
MTTIVQDVVLTMKSVPVAVLMMTNRVVVTAVSTTVPVAVVLMTRKNRAVAVRAMSVRKTQCMTARKPLARSV